MATRYVLSALLLIGLAAAFDPSLYSNSTILRENVYELFWKVQDDEIHIALKVQTTGWVGFGIAESTSGSMRGSDVITAYVTDDGDVFLQDRHVMVQEIDVVPYIDDCQSWGLVSGEEADGQTIIEVKRKLDTGDSQDRPIRGGITRIVWSFGGTDEVAYHGANRMATSVVFFGDHGREIPNSPDIQVQEFTNENYEIPPAETTYFNNIFPLTNITVESHIVAVEAIIDPNTEQFVHHFLLYGCTDPDGENCTSMWGWAPGVDPLITPPEAGFRAGINVESYKSLKTQTHFDNPALIPGKLDNSGIRIHYTSNLRQYDASVLLLGDAAVTCPNDILAGQGTASYEYNCPSECTSLWPHDIHIFGDMLHMHKAGDRMWSTHWRDGELLGELNRVEFYDFDLQQNTPMDPKSVVIKPGDRINTHCVYKREPNRDIPFSFSSSEEMCIEFVNYYPKLPSLNGGLAYRCGFLYFNNVNMTSCLDITLTDENNEIMGNPTVRDPPGGEALRFGVTPPDTYQCEAVVTEISASSAINPLSFLIGLLLLMVALI